MPTLELPRNTLDPFARFSEAPAVGGPDWEPIPDAISFGALNLSQFEFVDKAPLFLLVSTANGFDAIHVECDLLKRTGASSGFAVNFRHGPLTVFMTAGDDAGIHWKLQPGGSTITARADAIRLLYVLSGEGQARLQLGPPGPEAPGNIYLAQQALPDELETERLVFGALATLEEWTGRALAKPAMLNSRQLEMLLTAGRAAQTQRLHVTIRELAIRQSGLSESIDSGEVELVQQFTLSAGGNEFDMGVGRARVRLREIRRQEVAPGEMEVVFAGDERDASFVLSPPNERLRPTRRTQPRQAVTPQPDGDVATRILEALHVPGGKKRLSSEDLAQTRHGATTLASDALARLRSERLRRAASSHMRMPRRWLKLWSASPRVPPLRLRSCPGTPL